MDLDGIRRHWQSWARQYGTSLRATTKTSSAKAMELDALSRALAAIEKTSGAGLNILEAGCGNGQNCLNLLEAHPGASFTGIDFIEEMVEAANALKAERSLSDERIKFQVGNVMALSLPRASFDVVFTDRCLINLNTDALQQQAIASLAGLLKPGGHLLMIENSQQTYDAQNRAREGVGLPPRTPAEFNHFFDEATLLPFLPTVGLEVLDIEDFISLHDLVLYVLVPMVNGGKVEYEHPMVEAATQLNIALSSLQPGSAGAFGQNRLYKCRKAGA
ncbi:MAG TPA: class I SAM-dependent methyltransferase [Burkholderiales bacterium]|nr:class I SAM-dependent methyltransferase [Burkholderiales bacterium]